jgi:hypothetical protein
VTTAPHQQGIALVIAMVLLLAVTVLGVSGLLTAGLELQMAGNVQFQEEAFQAAEFGLEQAFRAATLSTAYTVTSPAVIPVSGVLAIPASTTGTYRYRLFYDTSAAGTPLPGGAAPGQTDLAFHFVVESSGESARGTSVTLTQSFYVLAAAACANAGATCNFDTGARRRSYWVQDGVE